MLSIKNTKDTRWLHAKVRGDIHSNLLKNILIEDLFVNDNEQKLQMNLLIKSYLLSTILELQLVDKSPFSV